MVTSDILKENVRTPQLQQKLSIAWGILDIYNISKAGSTPIFRWLAVIFMTIRCFITFEICGNGWDRTNNSLNTKFLGCLAVSINA